MGLSTSPANVGPSQGGRSFLGKQRGEEGGCKVVGMKEHLPKTISQHPTAIQVWQESD